MVIPLPSTVFIVLHVLTIISLIVALVAQGICLDQFSDGGWKVKTGCKPKNNCNAGFALTLTALAGVILFSVCTVAEILMVINIMTGKFKFVEAFRGGYLRATVYFVGGLLTLGMAGDLGIAGGSLLFVCGVIWLVIEIAKQTNVVKPIGKGAADA
jgi:hypothetical protein